MALAAPSAIFCHQSLTRAAPLNNARHITLWTSSSEATLQACFTSSDPGMLCIAPLALYAFTLSVKYAYICADTL